MKLLLLPDKFKGSLSAAKVCEAVEEGVRLHHPGAHFHSFAASDGGDGFLDAIRAVKSLEKHQVAVMDPLGRPVQSEFLLNPENGEAFVEMARASGLVLLVPGERNPLEGHTRGTGQLIRAAVAMGARKVFVGLGGSATSDGGMGIAIEAGFRFLDETGEDLPASGGNLLRIRRIIPPEKPPLPSGTEIIAVNDVSNPLWGPTGAAYVYGPQKGATPQAVSLLDAGLQQLDRCVASDLGLEVARKEGSGAAGGTAYGLKVFLGAEFLSGTDYMLGKSGARAYLESEPVDWVITGEGKFDQQSLQGKWIHGVLQLATQRSIPVLAVCGVCELDEGEWREAGLEAVIEISDPAKPLSWNMDHAYELIRHAVSEYFSRLDPAG